MIMSTSLILRFAPPQAGDRPRRGPPPKQPRRQAPRPPHNREPRDILSSLRNRLNRRLCWALAVSATLLTRVAVHLARRRLLDGSKLRFLLRGGARLNRAAISRMRHCRW